MSSYIGPRSADVPVGTIATKGTVSANSLVIGTNNATIGNSVYVVSNGNVGIGITTPGYTLETNGVIGVTGTPPIISYINQAGALNSNFRSSFHVNSSYTFTSSSSYFGMLSSPKINSNGINNSTVTGFASYPRIESSLSTDSVFSYGLITSAFRNSNNDIANSAGLYGLYTYAGHINGSNTSQSYNSGSSYGIIGVSRNDQGTITTSYGANFSISVGQVANKANAASTTAYSLYLNGIVGATSGTSTGTITNYYDAYLAGVTVQSTGTVTNKYGLYQAATNHINYFGGSVGIGNNSPIAKLHVEGEVFTGRVDTSSEGGQIGFGRSSDNARLYAIDCYGSGTNPELRMFNDLGAIVFFSASNTGVNYIKFNPTAANIGDANCLDDYEEGTWTPTDGSGAGLTLSASGSYVKIGRLVTVWARVTYPSTSSTALNAISGIPFSNNPTQYSGTMSITNHGSSDILPMLENNIFILRNYSNGTYTNANLSGKFYYFWACYTAA